MWRPIESAPKDRRILLYRPNYEAVAFWDSDFEWWSIDHIAVFVEPTHWMPLPDPPEDQP